MSATRSSPSWPSRCRSITEARLAAVGALGLLAACSGGGGDCGPGDAPTAGLTLTIASHTLTFGGFGSSANNDCTAPGGPTSLTVEGTQIGDSSQKLTLCLPAPDHLAGATVELGDDTRVQVVDFFAKDDACQLVLDRATAPTGTAAFAGFCHDGTDPAGYAITFAGSLPTSRTCPTGADTIAVALAGQVAVTAK